MNDEVTVINNVCRELFSIPILLWPPTLYGLVHVMGTFQCTVNVHSF